MDIFFCEIQYIAVRQTFTTTRLEKYNRSKYI